MGKYGLAYCGSWIHRQSIEFKSGMCCALDAMRISCRSFGRLLPERVLGVRERNGMPVILSSFPKSCFIDNSFTKPARGPLFGRIFEILHADSAIPAIGRDVVCLEAFEVSQRINIHYRMPELFRKVATPTLILVTPLVGLMPLSLSKLTTKFTVFRLLGHSVYSECTAQLCIIKMLIDWDKTS